MRRGARNVAHYKVGNDITGKRRRLTSPTRRHQQSGIVVRFCEPWKVSSGESVSVFIQTRGWLMSFLPCRFASSQSCHVHTACPVVTLVPSPLLPVLTTAITSSAQTISDYEYPRSEQDTVNKENRDTIGERTRDNKNLTVSFSSLVRHKSALLSNFWNYSHDTRRSLEKFSRHSQTIWFYFTIFREDGLFSPKIFLSKWVAKRLRETLTANNLVSSPPSGRKEKEKISSDCSQKFPTICQSVSFPS